MARRGLLDETKGALERLTGDLTRILGRAWVRIDAEQQRIVREWPDWSRSRRISELRALQNEVVRLMAQADELALRFTSRDLPTAYQIGVTATAAGLGTSAALSSSDLDVLGEIVTSTYDDLLAATTMVRQSTKELVRVLTREHLADKLIEGKTAVQVGRDLAETLADRGIVAVVYRDGSRHGLDEYAEMVARTRSAEAYAVAGMQKMATEGIKYVELGDGFGCGLTSHDDPDKANGMILTLEQARAYPTSHPRCVMPGQSFTDYDGIREMARAWYTGPAYTFLTTGPMGTHTATVGAYHPMLTTEGWRAAHLIREGDQLVYDSHVPGAAATGTASEANLEQVPRMVEDVFEALRAVGNCSSAAAARDDLHGDAVFVEGEVEVVVTDRPLLQKRDAPLFQHVGERLFVRADVAHRDEPAARMANLLVGVGEPAAGGVVGSSGSLLALLGREVAHLQPTSLGCGAHLKALATEQVSYRGAVDAELPADLLTALAVGVEPRRELEVDAGPAQRFLPVTVTAIAVAPYRGWVYDATTGAGAFAVNGIIARNCVRVQLARPDLVSRRDAANARPSTSVAQNVDQAGVAALRADAAGRRAAAAQRFARTSLGLTTDSPFRAGSVAAMRHARRVARRAS